MSTQTILPIIQARSNSSRLPGKILKPFSNSKNTLDHSIDLLSSLGFKQIVLATTLNPQDDELAERYCQKAIVYRGSEINVLSRFTDIIKQYQPDYVMRICADNPFLFKDGIQFLIDELSHFPDADYLSFKIWDMPAMKVPLGIFIELVRARALIEKSQNPTPLDSEHVTIGLYGHPDSKDKLFSFEQCFFNIPKGLRLTIDTAEDFALMDGIISALEINSPIDTRMLQKIIAYAIENHLLERMRNENLKPSNSKNYQQKKAP